MHRILIDSDVILDLFLDREPHHSNAVQFFSYLEHNGKTIKAFVSPIAIANVAYILTKARSQKYAVEKIRGLRDLVDVVPATQTTMDSALAQPHKDFEDTIQYYCARENNIRSIITRNVSDFPNEQALVVTPIDFVSMDVIEKST